MVERGRTAVAVLERYEKTVKPMHDAFIEPSKKYADIIIPQGGHNLVAIKVLTDIIKNRLSEEKEKRNNWGMKKVKILDKTFELYIEESEILRRITILGNELNEEF